MEIRDFRNVHEMLKETVDHYGDRVAYRSISDDGQMDAVSWNEFYDQVRRVAKSLIALGVNKNDKTNILSYSNYRWVLTDMATASIGSCAVGIYHSLLAKDVAHIVKHSDAGGPQGDPLQRRAAGRRLGHRLRGLPRARRRRLGRCPRGENRQRRTE
jgi:long-chain acyl-CoA synthetase